MVLNELGKIVQTEWIVSAEIRSEIEIDKFVIVPNHLHGIVVINNTVCVNGVVGAYGHTPLPRTETPLHNVNNPQPRTGTPVPNVNMSRSDKTTLRSPSKTVGAMIRGFKSAVTKQINQMRNTPGLPIWQRNYYEHIIRDEEDYQRIYIYIENNPAQWMEDELYGIA